MLDQSTVITMCIELDSGYPQLVDLSYCFRSTGLSVYLIKQWQSSIGRLIYMCRSITLCENFELFFIFFILI